VPEVLLLKVVALPNAVVLTGVLLVLTKALTLDKSVCSRIVGLSTASIIIWVVVGVPETLRRAVASQTPVSPAQTEAVEPVTLTRSHEVAEKEFSMKKNRAQDNIMKESIPGERPLVPGTLPWFDASVVFRYILPRNSLAMTREKFTPFG
jgi:hypothetical protein